MINPPRREPRHGIGPPPSPPILLLLLLTAQLVLAPRALASAPAGAAAAAAGSGAGAGAGSRAGSRGAGAGHLLVHVAQRLRREVVVGIGALGPNEREAHVAGRHASAHQRVRDVHALVAAELRNGRARGHEHRRADLPQQERAGAEQRATDPLCARLLSLLADKVQHGKALHAGRLVREHREHEAIAVRALHVLDQVLVRSRVDAAERAVRAEGRGLGTVRNKAGSARAHEPGRDLATGRAALVRQLEVGRGDKAEDLGARRE